MENSKNNSGLIKNQINQIFSSKSPLTRFIKAVLAFRKKGKRCFHVLK